jgi:16S rRNA (guanine527-N7)-methyltransferase
MRDRYINESSPTRAEEVGRLTRERLAEYLAAIGFDRPRFLERVERFATALALWGRRINLTAVPDEPAELAFHIVDSLMPLLIATRPEGSVLHELFAPGRSVLDLGSGAGFPGLILAAASECRFVLLESRRKRANFLRVTAAAMELANVEVDATRREPVDLAPAFDIVLGRAFAKPAQFFRSAAAALRPGGLALLYATPEQPLDLEAAASAGLIDHLALRCEVPRDRRPIARLLALWRNPS